MHHKELYRENGGKVPWILNLDTRLKWMVSFKQWLFHSLGKILDRVGRQHSHLIMVTMRNAPFRNCTLVMQSTVTHVIDRTSKYLSIFNFMLEEISWNVFLWDINALQLQNTWKQWKSSKAHKYLFKETNMSVYTGTPALHSNDSAFKSQPGDRLY